MIDLPIRAEFDRFDLPGIPPQPTTVVVPTGRGTRFSRYGTHAYYFLNLKTQKGVCVRIRHRDIVMPGLSRLAEAVDGRPRLFPRLGLLFKSYHYGFNFLEQIMLMTVPHTVTELGHGRYIVNLWSYFGHVLVDLKAGTVTYRMTDGEDRLHVFGSKQWRDCNTGDLYCMTYSLVDSMMKASNPHGKVFSKIMKRDERTGKSDDVWKGHFADYMHDILITPDNRYLIACELGRFSNHAGNLIPSKVLILDLQTKRDWIVSVVPNAAHAQIDPDEADVVYFSNHNFQFVHTPFRELFKKGAYTLKFLGPASVHKFRLTSDGPKSIAVFTRPDLFRLTNFHVFRHRGHKILAAMGAPNFIFLVDAERMELIKKVEVNVGEGAFIGTISPSRDGDKLYLQASKSFHVLDIESGLTDYVRSSDQNHTCSNHMITSACTDW